MSPGDTAPDFDSVDQEGNPVTLSGFLTEGPVVLFFYPRAMSKGCTAQSCHFRDLAGEFAEVGAQRVGISADSIERQAAFAESGGLDYPLLSDADRSIATAFGVKRIGPVPNRRSTFVIDTDRTILDVISSETKMEVHADRALETLRTR